MWEGVESITHSVLYIHNHKKDTSTPYDYSNYIVMSHNRKARRKIKAIERRKNVGKS